MTDTRYGRYVANVFTIEERHSQYHYAPTLEAAWKWINSKPYRAFMIRDLSVRIDAPGIWLLVEGSRDDYMKVANGN